MNQEMTSLQRLFTTLSFKEPDRVPFFLLATMHGAKELGQSLNEYFSKAENVVEGQLRLRNKYRHDCFSSFFYAALEIEAWGGEVNFYDDGPPNSGAPIIRNFKDILSLEPPEISETPCLQKILRTTELLKKNAGEDVPVLGVAISPFSLPIMQMGFEKYIDLIYQDQASFNRLMKINTAFCIEWSNAQLASGATAICYFDPMASSTITPREIYEQNGYITAREVISKINGPVATHLASGNCLPVIDLISQTGTVVIGVSALEDIEKIKENCKGELAILGNLNGIEMRRWTREETESKVKDVLLKAGPGGGFVLSDNHGEIPFHVPDEVLMWISEAVHKWGNYPMKWTV